jgi:mannose-6-phosphate isomerase-like protein (cupin superfamily)
MNAINLEKKLSLFQDYWRPRVIAELNGQQVKVVKFRGSFVWHHHDDADEMFLVVHGEFHMEFRDHHVLVRRGECIVVPQGVEHRPVAEMEVHVLLFEPKGVRNTGNVVDQDLTAGDTLRI